MHTGKVEPLYFPDMATDNPLYVMEPEDHHASNGESDTLTNLTLHQAARFLDVEAMTKLIQHLGKNKEKLINSHDNEKLSPLHYAAKSNGLDVVKLLVKNGADICNKGADEDTPLHYAARYRRQKKKLEAPSPVTDALSADEETHAVIEFLIPREVDSENRLELNPNIQNKYGQTPLHFAAMRGNKAAAGYLLSRVDVEKECQDKQCLTPLHAACIYNQTEIAQMLISAGADLHSLTDEKSTPLHLACAEGHVRVVELLFQNAKKEIEKMVYAADSAGYTCLHIAVDNNYYEITEMCLKNGADVNSRTKEAQMSPLHLAAAAGDKRVVALLLENNAKISALDDDQATALHKAAMYNHKDVVKLLLSDEYRGGNMIYKRDADGYTPFLLAAVYGHTDTLEILYNHNSHVTTATEKDDKNALHLAAEENKTSALKFLLSLKEFGPEVMRTGDRYACEPLHLAAEKGCLDAIKVLLDHGADIGKNEEEETPLHLAAVHGWKEIARLIVEKYPRSINDEDEDSNTPLHLASLCGQHETVDVLIDLEADVKCRNSVMWTPLDCAASKGWVKTARILLENDANVDAEDKTSTTPLHLAAQHGHVQMVNELLKAGANVTHRTDKGLTALDLAVEHNNKDCAIAILNSDKWQDTLRNQTFHEHKDIKSFSKYKVYARDTPMRQLIRKMPDVAEMIFNKCMRLPEKMSHDNMDPTSLRVIYDSDDTFEVEFTYEFLDDAYSKWDGTDETVDVYDANGDLLLDATPYSDDSGTLKKNHCLNVMVRSNREELLAHPLVLSLLQYKWNQFVRYVYTMNFCLYAVFLTFLTGYVVTTQPSYVKGDCATAQAANQEQHTFAKVGKYIIIILCAWHQLKEIYLSKLSYIGMENLIEWTVYVSSFLLVLDFDECQRNTGFREKWQWTFGAVAIFLAWVNLVLFIQKLPTFGIYVVMFTDILKTFIQFFVVFVLFIIAFSLGFYVLLQNEEPFATVQESIIKTSVMMIGEFDYLDIFYGTIQPQYKTVSYILFIVFTIIMSILIMNLLVGLAVDDIKSVQEKAELKRIAMQVDLALDIERILPECIRRKFIKRTVKMDLNAGLFSRLWKCMHLTGRTALTPDCVKEALNPELAVLGEMKRRTVVYTQDIIEFGFLMNFFSDVLQLISELEWFPSIEPSNFRLNDMKRIKKAQEKLQQKMEQSLHEINNKIDSILEAMKKS